MTKLVLVFLFTAASAGMWAAEVPVRISATNKWIIIEKGPWKAPSLEVLLRQADGTVLVNENIKKTTKFNLKYIPDGEYRLELQDQQKHIVQHMSVVDGILTGKEISTTYKPRIVIDKEHLDMNLMTQGLPANVVIRHNSGKVVYSEKIENEVSVTRRYNIVDLDSGEYLIDVALNNQVFTQLIQKK